MIRHGKPRMMAHDGVKIHGAGQLVHKPQRRNPRAAHQERRPHLIFAQNIRLVIVYRHPVIGKDLHDVLLFGIVCRKIIEQRPEAPIRRHDPLLIRVGVKRRMGEVDTGNSGRAPRQPVGQRELRLRGKRRLIILRRPRMRIRRMEDEILIRFPECLHLPDRPLHPHISRQSIRIDNHPIKATVTAAVYLASIPHEAHAVITAGSHLFRYRRIRRGHRYPHRSIKNLRMVRIHPRLDGGQRGERVLRHGKVIVKNDAARKEFHQIRHIAVIFSDHLLPAKTVQKDVEDDPPPLRTMPENDRRSLHEGRRRSDLRPPLDAKEARLPLTQPRRIVHPFRLKTHLLRMRRP